MARIQNLVRVANKGNYLEVFHAVRGYSRALEERGRNDRSAKMVSVLVLLFLLALFAVGIKVTGANH